VQKVEVLRAKRRLSGALFAAFAGTVLSGVLLSSLASAQGFQDALGPGAGSRALAGAVSAGAVGAEATFINPAGMARGERAELYVGLGLVGTHRSASPQGTTGPIGSEVELTPLPALAVALPLTRWLVLGGHAAPASFQGGAFVVDDPAGTVLDARAFRLLEAGPDLAVLLPEELLPGALTIGLGYRITAGSIERVRAPSMGPDDLRLGLSGADATGARVGVQYSPIPELRLGLSWQSEVVLALGAASGELASESVEQAQAQWTLPHRVAVGARFDLDRYGVALEYRFMDYSGTDLTYRGEAEGGPIARRETGPLGTMHSAHFAGEVRLSHGELEFPVRAGGAIESVFGSSAGASPFEPPPAPLGTISGGVGVRSRSWAGNLALATRFGSGHVLDDDPSCQLCAQAGDAGLYEWSVAFDFSVELGR
jgi:hypothetical protein